MNARLLVPDHFDLAAAAVGRCVALAKHLAAVAVVAAAAAAVVAAVSAADAAAAVVVAVEQPLEQKRGSAAAVVAVGLLAEVAGSEHAAASPSAVAESCSYSSTCPSAAASLAPAELELALEPVPLEPGPVESGLAPGPVLERERELVLEHGHVPPELEPEQLERLELVAAPGSEDDLAEQTAVVRIPNQPENIHSASDPEQLTAPSDTLDSTDPLPH